MFELTPALQGATLTLALTGDVLMPDVIAFNDVMRQHSKQKGIRQLVLDLGDAGKMDMSSLGALVSLNTSMQRYGRRLVLQRTPPHIQALLREAEIEGFFPMCETEEELKGFLKEAGRR